MATETRYQIARLGLMLSQSAYHSGGWMATWALRRRNMWRMLRAMAGLEAAS